MKKPVNWRNADQLIREKAPRFIVEIKGDGDKRGQIYLPILKVRFWPILLKKSVLAGAAFPELKKRTIWTLLRENQGSSVSRTAQIST